LNLKIKTNKTNIKQTAVEWLFLMLNNPNRDQEFANKLLEQAKQMEKEQIMLACGVGYKDGILYANGKEWIYETVEQYYNETYKQD